MMKKFIPTKIFMVLFCLSILPVVVESTQFDIHQQDGNWYLQKEGDPFYIKGAVGSKSLDLLQAYGANAVRIRANQHSLDRANQYGFSAMVGLPVRGERNDMDWDNQQMVDEQMESILSLVREFKDHPAVMFWAIGNELDHIPGPRTYNPILWQRLNDIAKEIKKIDTEHPVLTVIGSGRFEQKIQKVKANCPDFDLIGLNTYGDIEQVVNLVGQYWDRPFVVAEWGPTGHWQVPKTPWGVSIEQTSTEKAYVVHHRYSEVITPARSQCLGSFVFYWSEKQETTHTWYGLFRDGMKTESIDVMKKMWTGSWPDNRAPAVLGIDLIDEDNVPTPYLKPATEYRAKVHAYDIDYDELDYMWDIRPEVEIPENSYAGGLEKPAKVIPGLIVDNNFASIRFKTPTVPGPYRLFVQVTDGQGSAGYANMPFMVKE